MQLSNYINYLIGNYAKAGNSANLKQGLSICLEGLRKTTKISIRMVGNLAEVRTGILPNTSQNPYRLKQIAFIWTV